MTYFDLVLRPSRNVTTRSRMSSAFGEVNVYSSPFTFASVKLWPCILPVLQQSSTSTQPVWLIGAMVCLLAAPWVQSVRTGNGWLHNALRHHWLMPISCHFRDCKALLVISLTHINICYSKCPDLYLLFTRISTLQAQVQTTRGNDPNDKLLGDLSL